jgi:endonuclease YncB( thermonuclease family)
MQILPTLGAIAVATAAIAGQSHRAPNITRSDPVLVRFVIDGDTIDVASIGRVRLLGIDAPEIGRGFDTAAPFGRDARESLAAMVDRRWVRLEYDGPRTDTYNRHLAYSSAKTDCS